VTDYYALIAQAVGGLDQNTGKARRGLYERARASQVTQLRALRPTLSESAIAKERLSLESAIRKVETDAARKSGTKPRKTRPDIAPPRPSTACTDSEPSEQIRPKDSPVAFRETETPRPASPLPRRLPRWLTGKRARGFSDAVKEVQRLDTTAKAAQDGSDRSEEPSPSQICPPANGGSSLASDAESAADAHLSTADDKARQPLGRREPSYELDEDQAAPHAGRHLPEAMEDEHPQPLPPRSYQKLVRPVVTLLILASLAATISWQWPQVNQLYRSVAQIVAKQQPTQTAPQTASQSKFQGRVPQEQNTAQGLATRRPDGQASPTVAQRVVLYEEDSSDSQGKRYFGLVTWRTETVSPGPSSASELAVRAEVKIPERQTTMTWLLRRNVDHALAASHTVEIVFNLPAGFAGGGVASVPGIMMKQSEQAPGTPLAKLAVKATNSVFTIELSGFDADVQRNVQLLKESRWLDIPIVYVNGTRAIMAIEKGSPGDRAFVEAFAAWEK
jgi:hypothetical protein